MKTIKEIRNEANLLYSRSSHYITGTFFAVTGIIAVVKSVLDIIGAEVNMPYLYLIVALFSPIEYGMVKASLLAYEHRAKEVKTASFTLAGIKKYFKIMIPFVGRTLVIYLVQTLILMIFVYISSHSLDGLAVGLRVVFTGSVEGIFLDGVITIFLGTLLGIVAAIIIGFIVQSYFSLSYYYVIEDDMGLFASLAASVKSMKGHFMTYIGLRLTYLPYVLISAVIVNAFSVALTTMFQQLLTILPSVSIFVFNLILAIMVGLISTLISIMIYKVKETLAITVFYKEVRK